MAVRPRFRPAALLAALAGAAAGCGGGDAPRQPARAAVPAPAPVERGPLVVAATDLRLGPATAADRSGVRRLQAGRRVDPDTLRRRVEDRAGVGAGASCADADVLPDAANLGVVAAATLCLLNGERTDAGIPPLAHNPGLADAARGHSEDMVGGQYFAHVSADGRDLVARVRPTGYIDPAKGWTVGENIAWGSGSLASPRGIVAAWMGSPGHKDNLLNPAFREIGVGIVHGSPRARDAQGAATYTTVFGALIEPERAATARPAEPRARGSSRRRAARGRVPRKRARARSARRRGRVLIARVALGPRGSHSRRGQ